MRFLILSDIHSISSDLSKLQAYDSGKVSICDIESKDVQSNPLLGISSALAEYSGKLDGVLCLGDLAHHAKKLPLQETWRVVHKIADELGVSLVLGVTGNHDIASRPEDFEELENIKYIRGIEPKFPSTDCTFNDAYYLDGVAAMDVGKTTLICIDTCRLHGYGGSQKSDVFSVGNITDDMISAVVEKADFTDSKDVVVLMHHHPEPVDEVFDRDADVMSRGKQLMLALGAVSKPIFLLHGHKHMVKIKYAQGKIDPITILSAASLCSLPYSVEHQLAANQFHVLEIGEDLGEFGERGMLLSWEWRVNAWKPSHQPYMAHQLTIGRPPELTKLLSSLRSVSFVGFMSREELLQQVPDLIFASAAELNELNAELAANGRSIHHTSGQIKGMLYEEER
ncbi:metallophosphoesterase family protein [Jannaschia donghaensis]|uniref:Calcineurin-like phosphoesterase superfamily domain protein n=1 Tax=Jannaschia donghaensis TaxID=420998 RepID=A0A0M6YEA5_9RHOB|nr:metallophosphoesterase [Jannaschia donghaensis]CTQ48099.1 Calcineurin-like phosphoesterase superfamily domain protein [Jannaschia donghaensis]